MSKEIERPTQIEGALPQNDAVTGSSYIAASYVKLAESAGTRVIPLIYNDVLFQMILEKNDAGDHFPLYTICLGFELLTMNISKNKKALESFSAADMKSTLQFTGNINIEGTVFQSMVCHHRGCQRTKICLDNSTNEDDKVYLSTVHAYHYPVTVFQWRPERNAFEWGLQMIPHSLKMPLK